MSKLDCMKHIQFKTVPTARNILSMLTIAYEPRWLCSFSALLTGLGQTNTLKLKPEHWVVQMHLLKSTDGSYVHRGSPSPWRLLSTRLNADRSRMSGARGGRGEHHSQDPEIVGKLRITQKSAKVKEPVWCLQGWK